MDAAALGLGLACAAVEPGLGGVLLFNAPPAAVLAAARHLAALLAGDAERADRPVVLSAADSEDSLWGGLSLEQEDGEPRIAWRPGGLTQAGGGAPRVVAVPDLPRLSLPGARAAVVLLDAEVATLQRHGQDLVWAPELRWVAGCARAEAGEVSPHLLDRFALRLSALPARAAGRASDVAAWVDDPRGEALPELHLPGPSAEAVRAAAGTISILPAPTLGYILRVAHPAAAPGSRREIAFARLCRAIARLAGAAAVEKEHVDRAAELVGLRRPEPEPAPRERRAEEAPRPERAPRPAEPRPPEARSPAPADPISSLPAEPVPEEPGGQRPLVEPNAEVAFPAAAIAPDPYPEDAAPPVRETASLQPPVQRTRSAGAAEGPVTGTQRASDLRDIAWVSTALEAAKFRRVRPAPPGGTRPFTVTRADLRSYRRSPLPQQMLLLVMDYTALEGCDWQEALLPHLGWAYADRASVGIVRVGSARAPDPLRADRIVARGILAPGIGAALEEQRGTATPLAHGLELAAQTLQTEIQRGRGGVKRARLVVLTDGRGNVPLAASRAGAVEGPVHRRGIDDALQAARALGAMSHVDTFFLDPRPRLYPDLPLALAEALRATVEEIAPAAGSEGA